jgi:hypothetical protein
VSEGTDVLGLDDTWPRPGWVVLDAAREGAFSGEVEFDTTPPVRAYFDRGRIYVAERVTDPSLGARLVDAGALDAAQLEQGTIRIGDSDHLGRLFDRTPSVDRQAVTVMLELMTEEVVAWVARQTVRGAMATPYRRHPAGVHRWDLPSASLFTPPPGSSLPPPDPSDMPAAAPVPLLDVFHELDDLEDASGDVVIRWADPDAVDVHDRRRLRQPAEVAAGGAVADVPPSDSDPGGQALAEEPEEAALSPFPPPPPPGPPLPRSRRADLLEGFELIWPTGEVDEQFLVPPESVPEHSESSDEPDLGPGAADGSDESYEFAFRLPDLAPSGAAATPAVSDEVMMAVRRAVAAIETGAPSWVPKPPGHARLPRSTIIVPTAGSAEPTGVLTSPSAERELSPPSGAPVVPAAASGAAATDSSPDAPTTVRSDDPLAVDPFDVDPFGPTDQPSTPPAPARRSALKRLIAGLRRH